TRRRVASLTGPRPLRATDAVETETPARFATSLMVVMVVRCSPRRSIGSSPASKRLLDLRQLLPLGAELVELVQRIAAAHHPVAGRCGAVAERAAEELALHAPAREGVAGQVRIGQGHAAHADEIHPALPHQSLAHPGKEFLQVREA